MADSGLFIGWGEVVRGREAEAVETFNSTVEYFTELQSDGTIEAFEPVFLEQHGGDLNGFFFVKGDAGKLSALRVDPEFETVILRAGLIVENIGRGRCDGRAAPAPDELLHGADRPVRLIRA